eukprot:NODE_61_length_25240_cov_0.547194.p5 type:complete len:412 gc:universal NODE_61_length_25240_cov_0.547194:10802-9567(-)
MEWDNRSLASRNTSSEEADDSQIKSVAESVEIDVNPPKHKSTEELLKVGNVLGEDMLERVLNVSSHNLNLDFEVTKSIDKGVEIAANKVISNEDIVSSIPQEIPTISCNSPVSDGKVPELQNTPEPNTPTLIITSLNPATQQDTPIEISPIPLDMTLFDNYGFLLRSDTPNSKIKIDKNLESQWNALLANWSSKKRSKKLKKLCRFGIPHSVRGKVWYKLLSDDPVKPLLFSDLTAKPVNENYEVIDRDIGRSYPEHLKFRDEQGRNQLQSILRAFTQLHPEIGYCQGMGRLAGLLLMNMPIENAFVCFNSIIEKHIPKLYLPSLVQMRIDSLVFEKLINRKMPRLSRHLKSHQLHSLTFTTQWFMTLYTMALPWPTVLRCWDIFIMEGEKAIFKIGLAVLDCCKGICLLI